MLQITISKRAAFMVLLAVVLVIPVVALAGAVFDDVSDGSTHIDGITFMKDSGVSVGCDALNNYCPSDNVRRDQMGTFMYRLSGNDPATAPSVNADKLDGIDSTGFLGATAKAADSDLLDGLDSTGFLGATAQAVDSDTVDGYDSSELIRAGSEGGAVDVTLVGTNLDTAFDSLNDILLSVPVDGALLVSWSSWTSCGGADVAEVALYVNGVRDFSSFVVPFCGAAGDFSTNSFQNLIPVSVGGHNIEIRGRDFNGGANNLVMHDSRLTVVFVPFDILGGTAFVPLDSIVSAPAVSGSGPGS